MPAVRKSEANLLRDSCSLFIAPFCMEGLFYEFFKGVRGGRGGKASFDDASRGSRRVCCAFRELEMMGAVIVVSRR